MTPAAAVPTHVPSHLVRPFPFALGCTSTEERPLDRIISELHEGPDIFYAADGYPAGGGAWIVCRMEDLRAIYLDTVNFTSQNFSPFAKLIGETWNLLPAEMDPPDHARYRVLLNPLFAPKKMAALEDNVRTQARHFIAMFRDRGSCEFMRDFAIPFPVTVFLALVDLPQDRVQEFLTWERGLLHDPDIGHIIAATKNVVGYLREVIRTRRKNPGDDFISYGVKATMEGRPLTDDELVGYCFNLYVGGLDTVSSAIGMHFRHLADNLEDQRRLRAEPAQISTALEELMRAYAPSTTFRTCVKEVTVNGVTFRPGDKIAMATTIACRDPKAFEAPHEIRLDRNPAHIAFGSGPHRCIGSHLARREAQIALEECLAALPEFRIAPGATVVTDLGNVIQPKTLPLTWKV